MTGDVHHKAKAQDIIELTSLPTPGELYEPGCSLYQNELQSIFQKPKPNMSQMLSMMKPLPQDAEYPKEFFVKYLEYLPCTVYHILRHTLWTIKGQSSEAKLEGSMKTLVFYIVNGIRFNTQDFFIRELAASGIDLFGQKFYALWVMRLIKLHSTVDYRPSARNHIEFLPDVDMSVEAIYLEPAKKPLHLQNAKFQSFTEPIDGVHVPNATTPAYTLAGNMRLPHRANTEATASTIAHRPQKRPRVRNDRELLVALHQK